MNDLSHRVRNRLSFGGGNVIYRTKHNIVTRYAVLCALTTVDCHSVLSKSYPLKLLGNLKLSVERLFCLLILYKLDAPESTKSPNVADVRIRAFF